MQSSTEAVRALRTRRRRLPRGLWALLGAWAPACGSSDAVYAGAAARSLLPQLQRAGGDARAPLAAGDTVTADLILPEGGELAFEVHGSGNGRLVFRLELAGAGAPEEPLRERVTPLSLSPGGAASGALDLPAAGSSLLHLAALFESDDPGAAATFVRLDLRAPEHPRVPIVFVSLDTLSARHLELYGHDRATAPNLTSFAAEAIVFEHCWANAPWTLPSYISQFSGLLPWSHLVEDHDGYYAGSLAPERVTLAEALRAGGYRTAAFVDNPHLSPAYGVDQGFEVYDLSAALIGKRDSSGGARKVFADGLAWLDEHEARPDPYFLLLQAIDAHGPYLPEPPWRGAFAGDGRGCDPDLRVSVALQHESIFDAVTPFVFSPPGAEWPESVSMAVLTDAYDEQILQLDAELGELFAALAARGVLDSAVVVVSADHGESISEHNNLCTHQMPYEQVAHVPLLVRLPGGRGGGRRVAEPVQLLDLYPTLLELAGIAFRPAELHGRSLVAALEGATLEPVPLICQSELFGAQAILDGGLKLMELTPHPNLGGVIAFGSYPPVRDWLAERVPATRGLILGTPSLPVESLAGISIDALWAAAEKDLCAPRHELYRLASDPGEQADLAAVEPDEVARLAGELLRARERAAAARPKAGSNTLPGLDAELLRGLEDLGYAGGR